FLAGRLEPDRWPALNPVGVSGLMRLDQSADPPLVIARRSLHVTLYPGCWEFMPSGGLDGESMQPGGELDVQGQIRREFTEESGLAHRHLTQSRPFCFLFDPQDGVGIYDIGLLLQVQGVTPGEMESRIGSGEYDQVVVRPLSEMRAFVLHQEGAVVPSVHDLLEGVTRFQERSLAFSSIFQ
ncbi:MAG: hypothetical protein HQL53_09320, partial [Magnetococcales bacterium]|nr:hypothetical protein [Magnetococcales bacterium]